MRVRTIDEMNRDFVTGVIAAVVLGLMICMASCAGAPKNVQQFEQMDESDFQAWLTRVSAWAELAASQVVAAHPEDQAKITNFAALVEEMTNSTDPLVEAASQAGLDSPIANVLVLEAKALLGARGALPSGRALEFTRAVARGVLRGLLRPAASSSTVPIIGAECKNDNCFEVTSHGET